MTTLRKRRWVHWAVGYLLLCQIQALSVVDRTFYAEWSGKLGDKVTESINILQIVIGIALFYRGFPYWPSLRRGGVLSISLAIFMLCSAVWSVESGATLRAGVQYLFLIIGSIGVAENLEGDEFMDVLAWVCFLSAIASLVLPLDVGANEFRGVFPQKNTLGIAMAMGALASLHGLRVGKRRLFNLSTFILTTCLTVKSESMTSLLAITLFSVLAMAIHTLRKGGIARIIAITWIIILVPMALIADFNLDSLLETLGKDPTLTGRTDIWGYVNSDIFQRPLLGWGYAAFWSAKNPAAREISGALGFRVPHAHNGILEILLSVGLIGAVMFIYVWGRTVWLSLKCMRTSESAMAITCFLSCAGAVLVGVSETSLLYNGAITCVFFITGFFCERAVTTARWRQTDAFRRPVRVESVHARAARSSRERPLRQGSRAALRS